MNRSAAFAGLMGLALGSSALAKDEPLVHAVPLSPDGNLVVGLCDGRTSVEVKGVKPGEAMTSARAQQVSDQLMAQWKRKNPDAKWDEEVKLAQAGTGNPPQPAADSASAGAKDAARKPNLQTAQTYGAFGPRDEKIWAASTQLFVDQGKKVFHDAKELGGIIAVSCDMCHPDGSNTHPETYPKYQVQLGRVALLRDMINWCIENPVRGKALGDDDPKMKALEAYILSQRKGVPLAYGKH